jgi:hypothetical protein
MADFGMAFWPILYLWLFGIFSRLGTYVVPRKIWQPCARHVWHLFFFNQYNPK